MKTLTITNEEMMCPKCKHPVHLKEACGERVCDAAGDIDWCPCQIGSEK